ncbi:MULTISPECIES: hypothetical protein [Citrobacter]|uniref:hypothetical protein n=1 Tax=Citrobacter TaxID=544 RepID=UPI0023AFA0AD|nr:MULTISPECIES: hypothetical protein [Citrobacter]MDM3009589.1 hypothetical protein [Citrobacter sp. CK191]MDT7451275.1 hypothetical protein [Citrobacter koseri]HEM6827227.1 hypothetical protein [Citrobacter koseri]HEM6877545.1 hypothetical protein [Citrobacter koseri]HEM8003116.1 hypothetical protein [Citrobacter koseri]
MTDEEFTARMREIANGVFQPEVQRGEADDLIIEYLKSKGLDDAVAAYESIHRLFG